MDNKLERIIDIGARLKELRKEAALLEKELQGLIGANDTSLSGEMSDSKQGSRPRLHRGELLTGSVPAQILKIINEQPTHVFSADDLVTDYRSIANVRNALFRLASRGQIGRHRRGKFQALKAGEREPLKIYKNVVEKDGN